MTSKGVYPPLYEAITAVGLEVVETHVLCQQNTIAQYIATSSILELCLSAERRPVAWVVRRWW